MLMMKRYGRHIKMLLDNRDLDLLHLIALCKDIPADCSPLQSEMFSDTEFSTLTGAGYIRKSKSGLSYRLTDKGYSLLDALGFSVERDKYPVGNGGTLRRRLETAKTVLTMYRAGTDVFCIKLPAYLTASSFRRESRGAMLGASKLCGVRYTKTQLAAVYFVNEQTALNANIEMAAIENLSALLHVQGERMALFLADDITISERFISPFDFRDIRSTWGDVFAAQQGWSLYEPPATPLKVSIYA